MNLGQAFTRLSTLVGGDAKRTPYYPDEEAINEVNDWIERIVEDANPAMVTETFTTVVGTSAYTPTTARVKKVVYLKYDASGTAYATALKPITYKEAIERTGGDHTDSSARGTPEGYFVTFNSSGLLILNLWPTPDAAVTNGVKGWFYQGPAALAYTDTSTEIPVPHFFHRALPYRLAAMYYVKREDGKLSGIAERMNAEAMRLEAKAMSMLVSVQDIRQTVVDVDFGGF